MVANGINAYRKADVGTADQKRLIMMCYEGAIANMNRAKDMFLAGEFEEKAKALNKTRDIVSVMMCSLDFEKGGQIAVGLDALYNYMLRRMTEGDINKDMSTFDEIIGILEDLRSAWDEVLYGETRRKSADLQNLTDHLRAGAGTVNVSGA